MERMQIECDRARAYPISDARQQHPATRKSGQGLLHHPRRVQRKKQAREYKLRYASWNIGTMTGRARELADVLKRRRINVACLQETKWKGTKAREIGEGYKFYFCGSDGRRNGVGIVLDSVLKECVTDVKRVNDRIIVVKVVWEGMILNIVSVYVPQTGCKDEVKEKFWEDFDMVIINIPDSEELLIGGDFNGHVGTTNDDYERVHGGRGFGSRNTEGEALLEFSLSFDLAIVNTWFQKRDEHLITYKSGSHTTQIDYFLTRRGKLVCVKDCKVVPGEPLVSQHRLLLMEVKWKVLSKTKNNRTLPRIRWRMLEKEEYASNFKVKMVEKMIEMNVRSGQLVNECWNEMANYIRKTAREIFGETKGKGIIERDSWWWNDEVQQVLNEKKVAFKAWNNEKGSERVKDDRMKDYKDKKKKAKKAVAVARAQAQYSMYEHLHEPRGQKELYRITKRREERAKDLNHVRCIKDKDGKVLAKDEDIKGRWKQYFEELMNEENEWSGVLKDVDVNVGLVNVISINEVRLAVRSMKNGKAVGPDGIPVEVWKLLKEDGYKWLALFFNKLLHEELIPKEWCKSQLVPIFKNKGDIQECNNYRGIKLMSHTMKVWEKVIERRIRDESEITQSQFGFMPGRGTTDAIFAMRQLCEKYRSAHKNLHMVFVDLEKAYDRVPREVLWWALKEERVPVKYIELIRAMYRASTTHVRSIAGNTDQFDVSVGLHQGSALSPYLFLLVLNALTSDIQEEAPWCMLYADDIVLVSEDGGEVQNRLEKWQQKLENVGLKISRTKTEYMFCDFGGLSSPGTITLDGTAITVCSNFKYLGSLLQCDGEIDRAVQHRINSGWVKWRQVTGTICDPSFPLKLKGQVYKTIIRPAVLYGSESWPIKKANERRLNVAEMRMLRWMCGVTRMDKVRNEYIRGSLKVAPLDEKLRSNRLSWYGHVMRRDEENVAKKMLGMEIEGYMARGRPKKRWMDCVKEDMNRKGVNSEMTSDRVEWKDKTYCADPK